MTRTFPLGLLVISVLLGALLIKDLRLAQSDEPTVEAVSQGEQPQAKDPLADERLSPQRIYTTEETAFINFAIEFRNCVQNRTLAAMEARWKGQVVRWEGKIDSFSPTGTHVTIIPVDPRFQDVDAAVMDCAPESLSQLRVGSNILIEGKISTVSVLGPIITGK